MLFKICNQTSNFRARYPEGDMDVINYTRPRHIDNFEITKKYEIPLLTTLITSVSILNIKQYNI